MRWLCFAAVFVLSACPAAENPLLCTGAGCDAGSAGGGSGATGGGSGGGGATGGGGGGGGGVGGGAGGSSGDGGCVEQWACGAWVPTDAGTATRACLDLSSCGTTVSKPGEGPLPLPPLSLNFYKCRVQPIVERGCAMVACHGTETDRAYQLFARGRLRNNELVPQVSSCLGGGMVNLALEASNTVMCTGWSRLTQTEWRKNFDNARTFALAVTNIDDSELLAQATEGNYRAHAGVKVFASTTDPDYLTVRAWLLGADSGVCDAGYN